MCFFQAYFAYIPSGFKPWAPEIDRRERDAFLHRTYDVFLFVLFARKRVDDVQRSDILFLPASYPMIIRLSSDRYIGDGTNCTHTRFDLHA